MSAWEASTRFLARATSGTCGHEDLHDLQGDATERIEAQLRQAGCRIQMANEGVFIDYQGPPANAPVCAVLLQVAVSASMPATATLGVQIAKAAIRDLGMGAAIGHPGWQSRAAWLACQSLQRHAEWLSADIRRLAPTGRQKVALERDLDEVRGALQMLVNRLCDPSRLQHIDEEALQWLEELAPWARNVGAVSRDKLKTLMSHAASLALERAIQSPTKSGFSAWFKGAVSFAGQGPWRHCVDRSFFEIAIPCLLNMPAPSAAEAWLHEALRDLDPRLYREVAKQALLNAADSGRGPLLELPGWADFIDVDPVRFVHQDRQRVEAVSLQMIRNCAAALAADEEIASNTRALAVMARATQVPAQPNPACEIPCCNLV